MDKLQLTKAIIEEANLDIEVSKAYVEWWWPTNSNNKEHLRLTITGLNALQQILKPYHFQYYFYNSPKQIKALSKLRIPYYVNMAKITIFSENVVSMIRLYGSFSRYLDLIQND
jgi:hypothetical protein